MRRMINQPPVTSLAWRGGKSGRTTIAIWVTASAAVLAAFALVVSEMPA